MTTCASSRFLQITYVIYFTFPVFLAPILNNPMKKVTFDLQELNIALVFLLNLNKRIYLLMIL